MMMYALCVLKDDNLLILFSSLLQNSTENYVDSASVQIKTKIFVNKTGTGSKELSNLERKLHKQEYRHQPIF